MKKLVIVSFNVDCDNQKHEQIKELFGFNHPDIVFLQEVSEELKTYLETTLANRYPFQVSAEDQTSRDLKSMTFKKKSYLMILSQVPFVNTFTFDHDRPKRRILLSHIMGWHECFNHHGIDIEIEGVLLRALNLHIACGETERNKLRQFRRAVKHHLEHNGPTIICGDFNITTEPTARHLPALVRSRIQKDYSVQELLQRKQLQVFAKIVRKKGLHDVCGDIITYPRDGLVLDKILVSDHLKVFSKPIKYVDTYWSDHLPLGMELDCSKLAT